MNTPYVSPREKVFQGLAFYAEIVTRLRPGFMPNRKFFTVSLLLSGLSHCLPDFNVKQGGGSLGRSRPLLVEGGQAYVQRACSDTARKHSGLHLGDWSAWHRRRQRME